MIITNRLKLQKAKFSMLSFGDAFYLDGFRYIKVAVNGDILKKNFSGYALSLASFTVYEIDDCKMVMPINSELIIDEIQI